MNFNILHSDEGQSQKNFDQAMETFIALKPRPRILILPTDQWARRAVYRLRQNAVQVPEAVEVVGFDNLHYEDWDEKITTTQPDFVLMGERAVEVLQEEISSKNRMRTKLVLPCPILMRAST